jgi:hypothetical protein
LLIDIAKLKKQRIQSSLQTALDLKSNCNLHNVEDLAHIHLQHVHKEISLSI